MKTLFFPRFALLQKRGYRVALLGVLLAIALAFGVFSHADAVQAAPIQASHAVQASRIESPQMPYCVLSQVWITTAINPPGQKAQPLNPCDGLYVNCWSTGGSVGGDSWWEWVSWTSHYGYTYQGWVPDYAIETYSNPPSVYWPHC